MRAHRRAASAVCSALVAVASCPCSDATCKATHTAHTPGTGRPFASCGEVERDKL